MNGTYCQGYLYTYNIKADEMSKLYFDTNDFKRWSTIGSI